MLTDPHAQTMAISAVLAANLFNGLNTNVWPGWMFFSILFGIVLVWAYTVRVSPISVLISAGC
jgi:phospholipid-translocating ATPase